MQKGTSDWGRNGATEGEREMAVLVSFTSPLLPGRAQRSSLSMLGHCVLYASNLSQHMPERGSHCSGLMSGARAVFSHDNGADSMASGPAAAGRDGGTLAQCTRESEPAKCRRAAPIPCAGGESMLVVSAWGTSGVRMNKSLESAPLPFLNLHDPHVFLSVAFHATRCVQLQGWWWSGQDRPRRGAP